MRHLKAVFALTFALQASPAAVLAQDNKEGTKEEKKNIIEKLIPEEIRDVLDNAKAVIGFVGGIGDVIDAVGVLGQLFGLTEAGVTVDEQFARLSAHLETVKDELSRQGHAAEATRRYGLISSAVHSLMQALANSDRADEYLVRADADSYTVMAELEHGFSTPSSSGTVIGDEDGNLIYDWQLSVPELMQSIAMRLVVIKALDPSWQLNPTYIDEVQKYRDWLSGHAEAMRQGIRFGYHTKYCDSPGDIVGICLPETWIDCTDPTSGASNVVHISVESIGQVVPGCEVAILEQMGQPTILDVIAQLDSYLAGQ